jgi:hypothetical protein
MPSARNAANTRATSHFIPPLWSGLPLGWAIGREYARYHLGVVLLPLQLLTQRDREDFVVRKLSGTFTIEVFLLMRRRQQTQVQTDAIKAFRQAASRVVRESE